MRKYFGIVYRKIQKNKVNTFNKIAGLTLAVFACLLIAFYVFDEFSYDRFHSKKDRVYRLVQDNQPTWSSLMFPHLRDQLPGMEKIADFQGGNQQQYNFVVNQILFQEYGVCVADPDILDIFDFHIIEWQSREDLLVAPNTVMISRKMAKKFFNRESAVGQIIQFNSVVDLTITGVFEDFPEQSHINPQFLISRSSPLVGGESNHWGDQGHNAYILLSPNASPEEMAARIKEVVCNAAGDRADDLFTNKKFSLQPLTDIHLYSSDFTWDFVKKGDIDFVRMILLIGILILLVAATNHINLTITQTMGETKQFAIMKTVGGSPHQIRQYIYAGILLDIVIAVVLAAFVTLMILPVFGNLIGKQFVLGLETFLYMACLLVAIVVVVTFITAVYPAFLFSRIPVMRIFQKSYKVGGEYLRKGLIVFQFTVSVALIASTIFMYRQMQLLTNSKLGFNKEHLLVVNNPSTFTNNYEEMIRLLTTQYERFKTLVDKLPAVESIASTKNAPAGIINDYIPLKKRETDERYPSSVVSASAGFLPTLQANFIAGNDFTEAGKGSQIIVSRKLVEEMGETPESIVGKEYEFVFWGDAVQVVGVVDDIQYFAHRKSEERSGTVFFYRSFQYPSSIIVRIVKGDWRNTIAQLEQAWNEAVPAFPFNYQMMDERLEQNYKKELADIGTVNAFSIVAIVLSCFGVMGISHYTTRKRTKEIAIRKVHGASKTDIMLLLNSNYLILNLIAFVVAIPAVILFMNYWLQNFSYKTNLDWWVFVVAGLATSVVVLATVSWQSWRAATANPIEAIKAE